MVNKVLTVKSRWEAVTVVATIAMWAMLGRIMNELSDFVMSDADVRSYNYFDYPDVNNLIVDNRTFNYFFTKRFIDLFISIPLLIILSPFLLAIYIAIRTTDNGAGLFRQKRIGLGGREFYCFKFRTMWVDAEDRLESVLSDDPEAAKEWAKDHKLKDDPRVTSLGKFLRKTSLDELPQLWNIIKGEMSLVGPRPIVKAEIEKYGRYYGAYASVPPGVTGLWQVNGRNDTAYQERVLLDAEYATSQNIWFDLKILALTLPAVLLSRGAY